MNNSEQKTELKGIVDSITYRNRDNGYTVLKLKTSKDSVIVTGVMPYVSEGESIVVFGSYTVHQNYGQQFKADAVDISIPETQAQVLKYLSSGAIKGIGPATAIKIVETFREDALDIIENSPLKLTAIKGISIEKATSISDQYKQQFGIRDIMLTLSKFKISPNEAADIFKTLGLKSLDMIKENPYVLCNEGINFSFDRAEEIADTLHISPSSKYRISAGINYVLRSNLGNGHTCLPKDKLVIVSAKLLSLDAQIVEDTLVELIESLQLYSYVFYNKQFIFLPEYAASEEYISSRIKQILKNNIPLTEISLPELNFVQDRLGIKFDKIQIDAVNSAMRNSLFVLTGGPGTGKTTTLNAIIEIFDNRQLSIALAAPTGRAAKRMTEVTGRDAKTIHRLLETEWGSDSKLYFAKNKRNQIDADVVIIDEMSMVDVQLFRALLEAVRATTRIVLVGDSDQLPSVGAGNILNDIIESDMVPYVRLEKIFRQEAESSIVTFAHDIIRGIVPDNFEKADDFFFITKGDAVATSNTVVNLCSSRLPEAYGFSSLKDIQVLCPSRKKECGTHNINNLLQDKLNPKKKKNVELYFAGVAYRVGDKVINIKNDYDILWENDKGESGSGIYNGDIGFIEEIDTRNRILKVRFDDKIATYYEENLNLLELAYAITVHKSQGCEFDCVIIPLFDTTPLLQYRNLLYTGITRAKKFIVLVGDTNIFKNMIQNDRKTLRYTALKFFLEDN